MELGMKVTEISQNQNIYDEKYSKVKHELEGCSRIKIKKLN